MLQGALTALQAVLQSTREDASTNRIARTVSVALPQYRAYAVTTGSPILANPGAPGWCVRGRALAALARCVRCHPRGCRNAWASCLGQDLIFRRLLRDII